jgi:hypothetical protein
MTLTKAHIIERRFAKNLSTEGESARFERLVKTFPQATSLGTGFWDVRLT